VLLALPSASGRAPEGLGSSSERPPGSLSLPGTLAIVRRPRMVEVMSLLDPIASLHERELSAAAQVARSRRQPSQEAVLIQLDPSPAAACATADPFAASAAGPPPHIEPFSFAPPPPLAAAHRSHMHPLRARASVGMVGALAAAHLSELAGARGCPWRACG
jgi:hypothetical protein